MFWQRLGPEGLDVVESSTVPSDFTPQSSRPRTNASTFHRPPPRHSRSSSASRSMTRRRRHSASYDADAFEVAEALWNPKKMATTPRLAAAEKHVRELEHEVKNLRQKVQQLTSERDTIRTTSLATRKRAEEVVHHQHLQLKGAIRRLQYLIEQRDKLRGAVVERQVYITRLERHVVQQNQELVRLRAGQAPQAHVEGRHSCVLLVLPIGVSPAQTCHALRFLQSH